MATLGILPGCSAPVQDHDGQRGVGFDENWKFNRPRSFEYEMSTRLASLIAMAPTATTSA